MTQISLFSSPFLLGFDQLERALDRVSKSSADGYPPYNIEQGGENALRITLAVAGFSRDELSVVVEGTQLTVLGKQGDEHAQYPDNKRKGCRCWAAEGKVTATVQAEEPAQNITCLAHARGVKEHPADHDNEQRPGLPQSSRPIVGAPPWVRKALDGQPASVPCTPKDKRPCRTMPETAKQHCEQEVAIGKQASSATAAEGDIEVIT